MGEVKKVSPSPKQGSSLQSFSTSRVHRHQGQACVPSGVDTVSFWVFAISPRQRQVNGSPFMVRMLSTHTPQNPKPCLPYFWLLWFSATGLFHSSQETFPVYGSVAAQRRQKHLSLQQAGRRVPWLSQQVTLTSRDVP